MRTTENPFVTRLRTFKNHLVFWKGQVNTLSNQTEKATDAFNKLGAAMAETENLRRYYNKEFKREADPEFDNLDDYQIKALRGSLGFSGWQIRQHTLIIAQELNRVVGKVLRNN